MSKLKDKTSENLEQAESVCQFLCGWLCYWI